MTAFCPQKKYFFVEAIENKDYFKVGLNAKYFGMSVLPEYFWCPYVYT